MLKEAALVSRVASPRLTEALSADCSRLREAASHAGDLIRLKRGELLRGERPRRSGTGARRRRS